VDVHAKFVEPGCAIEDRRSPAFAGAISSPVRRLDPTLPAYRLRTTEEGLEQSMAQARFNTALMLLLGLTDSCLPHSASTE
jgi:hypothetical protein